MFETFQKMIADVAGQAETMFARVSSRKTFDRVVYAAYLIARADGSFDAEEKTALANLISRDFPQFKLTDILETLNKATEKVEFDATLGVAEIVNEIGKASGEDAELIVRTACFIGAADGNFDEHEKNITRRICAALNLQPAAYGL